MEYKYNKQKRKTGIEWTSATWNPFVGCSIKSLGCKNCYAMNLADRLEKMGQKTYIGTTKKINGKAIWTGLINNASDVAFYKPEKIMNPSIFFVNSMSDFFHENVPNELQFNAYKLMEKLKRHQFQILTKRPDRIELFLKNNKIERFPDNLWIGATVENYNVKNRIDIIRNVPAKIKFLSVEPLLGPLVKTNFKNINWVITGGESGPGSRPMEASWIREINYQLKEENIPHFFKQYGRPENNPIFKNCPPELNPYEFVRLIDKVGKGGSLLDDVYIKEMPNGFEVPEYDETLIDKKD